jgi:thymidylate synthase (FAD)|tara:strand:- start:2151 stop:2783 length:633 start_codon:yes stop_codon:yes gene_type:complete
MTHHVKYVHSTPDGDNLVAYMARVSNPENQNNTETSARLIRYLIKHKHWSPFEMVNMCVEINTTRSIAAQILRHRSFSFQEFSQRYSKALDQPGPLAVRRQDTKNRQNSVDDIDPYTTQDFQIKADQVYELSFKLYNEMLAAGVAKECAREVLPLSTPTRLYMNGTLRSWLHYCDLRCANGTQLEHQIIADECKELLKVHFPLVFEGHYG